MRRLAFGVLASTVAAAGGLVATVGPAGAAPTQLFSSTGPGYAEDAATVPAGICFVTVDAAGGEGGATAATPGLGAHVVARVPVTPGAALDVLVAGAGGDGGGAVAGGGGVGGGGGGAASSIGGPRGGGGGGATAVSTGGSPLVVAGGGGGAGGGLSAAIPGGNAGAVGSNGAAGGNGGSGGSATGDGGNAGESGGGGGGVDAGGTATTLGGAGGAGTGLVGGGGGSGTVNPGGAGGAGTGAGGGSVSGGAGGAGSAPGGNGGASGDESGGGGGGSVGVGGGGGGRVSDAGGGGAGYGGGSGGPGGPFAGGGSGGSSFAVTDATLSTNVVDHAGDGALTITYDPDTDACPPEPVFQPDGAFNVARIGNGVYNATGAGQTILQSARPTRGKTWYIYVQNDGDTVDDIRIQGTGPQAQHFNVVGYRLRLAPDGSFPWTVVTAEVVGGTFVIEDVPPGGEAQILLAVNVGKFAPAGTQKTFLVTATSVSDPTKSDTVRAIMRAT
jgi:hypothetical protein